MYLCSHTIAEEDMKMSGNKELFEAPEVEVVLFEAQDVIAASGEGGKEVELPRVPM